MSILSELSATDAASLAMSALGLFAGTLSTFITMNSKYYEDQRQMRTTVGDLAQKILALRGEEELLNVKALRGEERTEEFVTARNNNLRTQLALARLMVDVLNELKRPASAPEYEVLANVLTTNGDPSDNRYWRMAIARSTEKAARLTILAQYAYAKIRFGRQPEGEQIFIEAQALAKGEPVHEGFVHEARAKALHAIRKLADSSSAFDAADAAYRQIQEEGARDTFLQTLASARKTLGLG